MTRNRKAHLQGITEHEQQTLFMYRRRKSLYWKHKAQVQIGKRRMANKMNCQKFPPAYKYQTPVRISRLKRKLRGSPATQPDPAEYQLYERNMAKDPGSMEKRELTDGCIYHEAAAAPCVQLKILIYWTLSRPRPLAREGWRIRTPSFSARPARGLIPPRRRSLRKVL